MLELDVITNTFVDLFRQIPEILPFLANNDPANIVAYVDDNPDFQSLDLAQYAMAMGQILVALREGEYNQGDTMSSFNHTLEVALRSLPGQSTQKMLSTLVNGVPAGQNLRWRLMQPLPEIYSTDMKTYSRVTDAQQIDYFVAHFEVMETGDA